MQHTKITVGILIAVTAFAGFAGGLILAKPFIAGAVVINSTSPDTKSPDTKSPDVVITSPGNGSSLSGIFTLTAVASDNVGVTYAQFSIDGVNVGPQDTSSPYSISGNTNQFSSTNHTLTATAYDAAGNVGYASISVVFSNGPNTQSPTQTTTPPPPPPPPYVPVTTTVAPILVPPPTPPTPPPTPAPAPTQFPGQITPVPNWTPVPPPPPTPGGSSYLDDLRKFIAGERDRDTDGFGSSFALVLSSQDSQKGIFRGYIDSINKSAHTFVVRVNDYMMVNLTWNAGTELMPANADVKVGDHVTVRAVGSLAKRIVDASASSDAVTQLVKKIAELNAMLQLLQGR